MAINPSILLQSRPLDLSTVFSNVLSNVGRIDDIKRNRQTDRTQEDQDRLKSLSIFGARISPILQSGDIEGARRLTQQRIEELDRQNRPSNDSREFLQLLDTNPQLAAQRANQAAQIGQKLGFFSGVTSQTAGQRERGDLLRDVEGAIDPQTGRLIPTDQMTATQRAAAIKLRLIPAPVGSSIQTIAQDEELTRSVAESQGLISEAKEGAKQKQKLKFGAEIARTIAKAKQEVEQRGGVFSELNQAEAALPGLEKVVSKLKLLSGEATFTLAGRVFDTTAKELFGIATKGATARDKMISLVSNQVLPLLKPIFGSQFTEREGDRLIAAFADVNSTPESRRGQLDSFLDQMRRNIAAKRGELEGLDADRAQQPQGQVLQFDAQGNIIQ